MATNKKRRRSTVKQIAFVVFLLAVIIVSIRQYYVLKERARFYPVEFVSAAGGQRSSFMLEAATTDGERQSALRYKKILGPGKGVILVYPQSGKHAFPMKEIYAAIDLVFLDSAFKVVAVVERPRINSSQAPGKDLESKYIVAIAAEGARKNTIVKGDRLVPAPERPLPVVK